MNVVKVKRPGAPQNDRKFPPQASLLRSVCLAQAKLRLLFVTLCHAQLASLELQPSTAVKRKMNKYNSAFIPRSRATSNFCLYLMYRGQSQHTHTRTHCCARETGKGAAVGHVVSCILRLYVDGDH